MSKYYTLGDVEKSEILSILARNDGKGYKSKAAHDLIVEKYDVPSRTAYYWVNKVKEEANTDNGNRFIISEDMSKELCRYRSYTSSECY